MKKRLTVISILIILLCGIFGTSPASATVSPMISCGNNHVILLKSDGTVWTFGDNQFGQLGNNTTTNSNTPVQVSGLTDVIAINAGCNHSMALKSDGTVWTWGQNSYGQLGDNTTTNSSIPIQVNGLSEVTAIAAGSKHSLVLKSDSTVWSWGNNSLGQLGTGTITNSLTPIKTNFASSGTVIAIAAAGENSTVLKSDGTVYNCGNNAVGQLGNNSTSNSSSPAKVRGLDGTSYLTGISAISPAYYNGIALGSNGSVYTWGGNNNGELGNGTTTSKKYAVQVSGLSGVIKISGSKNGAWDMALKSDGTIWTWGFNGSGQMGDGSTTQRTTPVQVLGSGGTGYLTDISSISAGEAMGAAIKSDGSIMMWGSNYKGQLGNGTTGSYKSSPVQVVGPGGIGLFNTNSTSTPIPVTGIALNKTADTVLINNTDQLIATITPVNADDSRVTWSSSDITKVIVDSNGKITALASGSATITATTVDGGYTATCTVDVQVPVSGITLNQTTLNLLVNGTATLVATVSPDNATDKSVTWLSSNPSVVTVDQNGNITAIAPGDCTVTATTVDGNKSASCEIIVTVPVSGISLNKTTLDLVVNNSETLIATVLPDAATNKSIAWTTSDPTIAIVDNSGLITGIMEGSAIITATTQDGGLSATCTVNVVAQQKSKVLAAGSTLIVKTAQSLAPISYTNSAGFSVLENGKEIPVTNVVVQDGSEGWPYSEITLTSGTPLVKDQTVEVNYIPDSSQPISITDGGSLTSASQSDIVNNSEIIVENFTVEPVNEANLTNGLLKASSFTSSSETILNASSTQQLSAKADFSNSISQEVTGQSSYSSDNPEIASVSDSGLVSAMAPGTAMITASYCDKIATCTFNVPDPIIPVNSVSLNKESLNLLTGETETLIATILPENATDKSVTWVSNNPAVANVDQNGNITAIAAGEATISVTTIDGGKIATCIITVSNPAPTLQSITAVPNPITMYVGDTQDIIIKAQYSDGSERDITGSATLQSDTSTIALTSGNQVIGVAAGNANISISYEDKNTTIGVTVNETLEIISISITPAPIAAVVGKPSTVKVNAKLSDGSTTDITTSTTLSIANASIASITDGVVTGTNSGSTTLTATYQGKSAKTNVTVQKPTNQSLIIAPDAISITVGKASDALVVKAVKSDGSEEVISNNKARFTVGNKTIAQLNSKYQVIGKTAGNTTLTITYGGFTQQIPVTVTDIVPPPPTNTQTETITVSQGGSKIISTKNISSDINTKFQFTSSNTSIATISGTRVYGVKPGSCTITVTYSNSKTGENGTCQIPVQVTSIQINSPK